MEEYRVSLDQFVGPLDLLLHLIKEKEMDLENLELSKITDQYLDYLHQYQAVNLEVAREYLVIASSLIEF
ncbi:MAG: segregation/condensation protein A [Beduini sp.]|uniref:segregation/condensation protein A n=1 Tax=Beduini sp. TaxID=1922300 RepID=UPI0039A36587